MAYNLFFMQLSEEISEFYQTYRSLEQPVSVYKVPFLSALDLVQTRQVVIKGVSDTYIKTVVLYKQRLTFLNG